MPRVQNMRVGAKSCCQRHFSPHCLALTSTKCLNVIWRRWRLGGRAGCRSMGQRAQSPVDVRCFPGRAEVAPSPAARRSHLQERRHHHLCCSPASHPAHPPPATTGKPPGHPLQLLCTSPGGVLSCVSLSCLTPCARGATQQVFCLAQPPKSDNICRATGAGSPCYAAAYICKQNGQPCFKVLSTHIILHNCGYHSYSISSSDSAKITALLTAFE